VNAQPDRKPPGADGEAVSPAAATWVPPESPDGGVRPAWMPPEAQQPYGQAYGSHGSHGSHGAPPYVAPPPAWQQPPHGQQPLHGQPHRKPRMPRWAKIVVVVGVITYVLGFIGELVNLLLSR
jgi:hypothetical protein